MSYYIRVLSKTSAPVSLEILQEAATPGVIALEKSDADGWAVLSLNHPSGEEIAIIERNPVRKGELGYEELTEFQDEVKDLLPESGARWLENYLPAIQVIHVFQLLDGTEIHNGWSVLHAVYSAVWKIAQGILQSDGEGFSNEDGYTIVWQFADSADGDWNVGVLSGEDWIHYKMDLGNRDHRQAFFAGKIPAGIERI